jgi:hypothetical protein
MAREGKTPCRPSRNQNRHMSGVRLRVALGVAVEAPRRMERTKDGVEGDALQLQLALVDSILG